MPEITQEELDTFEAYKQLGTVEDLLNRQVETTVTQAATSTGFKKSVLERLLKTLPAEYNLLTSTDGVFVNTPDGDVELTEFAEKEWAEFMPSLKADSQERKPVAHIRQSAEGRETGKKNVSKKMADSYVMQQYGWALKSDSVN